MRSATVTAEGVLADLEDRGVRWVLLRGALEPLDSGRDLDLLVDPAHLPELGRLVREAGGVVLPPWLHPWHRSFLVDRAAAPPVRLDVVTELTYNRTLRFRSGLAAGVLDRSLLRGALRVPSPTDQLWTVLLHCLLDKQAVAPRRARELLDAYPRLERPSEAERVVETALPRGWSPERLLAAVGAQDWGTIAALGSEMSPRPRDRLVAPPREAAFGAVRAGWIAMHVMSRRLERWRA